jgi:hypothetical protein
MADDHIGTAGPDDIQQVAGVTEQPSHRLTEANLTDSPLKRGERIGTGIHHGDSMPEAGDLDGQPSRAAAEINDMLT